MQGFIPNIQVLPECNCIKGLVLSLDSCEWFDSVWQDPNCQDARGNWAFLKASTTAYCKSEILRLLHEASADVRVADRSGRTALHAASSCDEGDQC